MHGPELLFRASFSSGISQNDRVNWMVYKRFILSDRKKIRPICFKCLQKCKFEATVEEKNSIHCMEERHMQLLKKINYRITLIALIILVQLLWGTLFLMDFVGNRQWISVMLSALSLLVVLFLNMKEENASYKIGWIILIMTLPVFGGLFYLLFGNKRPSSFMRMRLTKSHESIHPLLPSSKEILEKLRLEDDRAYGTAKYVAKKNNYPIYEKTDVKYYPVGEEMFSDMIRAMEKAKHFIYLE